jgi:ribosome-associated protein
VTGAGGEALDEPRGEGLVEGAALAALLARAADELKAEDVRVLDVPGLTDVMDFMVLATAGSVRQLRAVCDAAEEAVGEAGRHTIGQPGEAAAGWVVVDTGDVVCHLMTEALRAYYDLDGLWADARAVDFAREERGAGGARGD